MMYRVQYSPKSKEHLMRIKSYNTYELNENLAKETIKKVMAKIHNLEEFPLMGKPISNLIDVPTDYLYLVTEKNYIFYRNEEKIVKIVRVLNERQDYMRVLFGIEKVKE